MKLLLSIALFLPMSLFGQEHPILNYFSANLGDNDVYLSWEIMGGGQCNGIQILRSTDSLNYVEIGDVQGVCGSPDFAQQYDFTDESPVENSINYYRLELGVQGFSSTQSVHYVATNESGYVLYPNPVTPESILYWRNSSNDAYTFQVFDLQGKMIVDNSGIQGNQLTMNFPLDPGMYVFRLFPDDGGNMISGKLYTTSNQ